MSKILKVFFLVSACLSIVVWRFWPKVLPIPESERQHLFEYKDFEKLIGRKISDTPLKNGEDYRYSEIKISDCINRGLMRNGVVGERVFNFRSGYQICSEEKSAQSLYQGNELLDKIPGIKTVELSNGNPTGHLKMYVGNGSIVISGFSKRVYYSLQIEPEIEVEEKLLLKMVLERMDRLKNWSRD